MTLHLTLDVEKTTIRNVSELGLQARFENRGKTPLSAVIHATPLSHGKYSVEIQDSAGRPADLDSFGMCGTMAPLMDHEIFVIDPGAVHRVPVGAGGSGLGASDYRVRVRYQAYESDHAEDSRSSLVKERLRHFWTGTLVSDWVPFAIRPTA